MNVLMRWCADGGGFGECAAEEVGLANVLMMR